MMTKQFLTTFFAFLFFSHMLFAQTTFAPPGAVWRYNAYTAGNNYGANQYRYVATSDTLLNGWNAQIIQGEIWTDGAFVLSPVMTRYVAVSGSKVYHRVDTSFVLLYDFDAQPGDTIFSAVDGYFPFWNFCSHLSGGIIPFSYVIDSVGTMTIDGTILRTQYVRNTNAPFTGWNILGIRTGSPDVPLIERIGSPYMGTWFGGNTGCIQEGSPSSLRCYADNEIFFEGDTQGLSCDSVVSTSAPVLVKLAVGPNPFKDVLIVKIPDNLSGSQPIFRLLDLLGQEVFSTPLTAIENKISTGSLPPGMYVWQVEWRGKVLPVGKVVKM